jgi:hypothetical protein
MRSSQKPEEPRHREQQHLWISVVQIGPGQEVRETVTAGSVASQHQTRSLDRPLDDSMIGIWLGCSLK